MFLVAATLSLASHAAADGPFLWGPYVDHLTAETATVHVRTTAPSEIRVTFHAGALVLERVSGPATRHAVLVSGLPQGTDVRYDVALGGGQTASGTFRTPPAAGSRDIDFVALGDSRDGGPIHRAVVDAIRYQPDFVLHLGDMVPRGYSEDEWTDFFSMAAPILKRTSIVPVLGNHELIADPSGRLYREAYDLPGRAGVAYYTFEFGDVRVLVLDSNTSLAPGSPQDTFARTELERGRTDALLRGFFVALHHGPMSSGRHGGLEVLTSGGLTQVMRDARVDLVISGHDHMYERGDSDGLKYIVTGGAGSPLYRANAREPYQLAFVPEHHFVRIHVGADGIVIEPTRTNGVLIERCRFQRGQPFTCDTGSVAGDPTRPPTATGPVQGISPAEDWWSSWRGAAVLVVLILAIVAFVRWRRKRSEDP